MRVLFCWSFFGCVVFKKRRVLVGNPVCFFFVCMLCTRTGGGFCDYDGSLRGQQRANDGCCSFGMLMTMMVRWRRRRRRTTPGLVRIEVIAPATVVIVGIKAAGTLQIPVHLNTLINCTAPKNKKKIGRENKMETQWSRFFFSFLHFSLTISLSSHWHVFLSSQYSVNLFSVKKFAHLVSFFFSLYTRFSSVTIYLLPKFGLFSCPSCFNDQGVWLHRKYNIIALFPLFSLSHFFTQEIIDSCLADSACAVTLGYTAEK